MTYILSAAGLDKADKIGRFSFAVAARTWADEIEPIVAGALKAAAPVGNGPTAGRLRDSISNRRTGSVIVQFTTGVPYATYVMRGTRPHTIAPRNAKALYWSDSGGSHFARLVHHPGTKPNPFVEKAVRPLMPLLAEKLAATVQRTLQQS